MMTSYELAQQQLASPHNDAHIVNALVIQKDHLLSLIPTLGDEDDAQQFLDLGILFAPLWKALQYGYKMNEIIDQSIQKMWCKVLDAESMRDDHSRKNSSQWGGWNRTATKLGQVIVGIRLLKSHQS